MSTANPKSLVIGGEGFIGSYICEELERRKWPHVSVDIKSDWDVRDPRNVEPYYDYIFNLASVAGVRHVEKDPIGCVETSVLGMVNVMRNRGKAKVIYFSSSEVYGPNADRNREDEAMFLVPPGQPRWAYQAGKLAAEHITLTDPRNLVIRPFNVFGKGQKRNSSAMAGFMAGDITIYGNGEQVRTWLPIGEFIEALFALIDQDCSGIYNIGGTNPMSTLTLARLVQEVIGTVHTRWHDPIEDVLYRVPNIDKITRDTGWKPRNEVKNELWRMSQ